MEWIGMDGRPLKQTKKTVLGKGRFLQLVDRAGWEFVERHDITGIVVLVAVTPAGKLLLIEQHREPVGGLVIELPAGVVGDIPGQRREGNLVAAKRELFEETGYIARRFSELAEGPPSCGLSSEIVTFYWATGLKKVGLGGGDEKEAIRVHEVPLDRVSSWLKRIQKRGIWVDPKVFVGVYFAEKSRHRAGKIESSRRKNEKR